jgi:hypothetical protein
VSIEEAVKTYGISRATAFWYRQAGVDLDDPAAVARHKSTKKTRLGVGKYSRRTEVPLAIVPAPPTQPLQPTLADVADGESMLARLKVGEEIAFKRYQEFGSDRWGQIWLATCDQRRKAEEAAAKRATDCTAAESKLTGALIDVFLKLCQWLDAYPKTYAMMCEGLDRTAIEPKLRDGLYAAFRQYWIEFADVIDENPALKESLKFIQSRAGIELNDVRVLGVDS